MHTDKNEDFESISQLIDSGLLGKSRKQIMRMINEGVNGKKLFVDNRSSFFGTHGNRYLIKRRDVVAYSKYLDGLN